MCIVVLSLSLSLLSATPSSAQSLTSTPEWQMLKDSLNGIGVSLKGVSQPLTDLSQYFDNERSTLDEQWRLLQQDKDSFERQKAILEERARLYGSLRVEVDSLKEQLDVAYSRGITWAAIVGATGLVAGLIIGGVLF